MQPVAELWCRVEIKDNDMAALSASEVVRQFAVLHRAAGGPPDSALYVGRFGVEGRVFYFTPHAAGLADSIFAQFKASELSSPPDLANCHVVNI